MLSKRFLENYGIFPLLKIFSLNQYNEYLLNTDIYTFGETIKKLEDYSINDEYTEIYMFLKKGFMKVFTM